VYSSFTDRQLELLIRHQLKKYPHLLKQKRENKLNPNFKLVHESAPTKKIIKNQNESRLKAEK
jgi:hypothetical protein